MQSKALWLKNLFGLNDKDISNLIGNQSYIYRFYLYFTNYIKYNFKCNDEENCLNELVYRQLLDGSVTKILNIDTIQNLNMLINPEYYPFIKTPEIKNYFEGDFKYKMRALNNTRFENLTFEDMEIDLGILKTLILEKNTTLLKLENSIDFVFFNYTKNLYSSYLRFNIQTLEQLIFFADYFVNFIPSTFLYPLFQVTNQEKVSTYYGNRLSNALVSLIPAAVNTAIYKIENDMEAVLIARIAYEKLKSEENKINCHDLFMKVTKKNNLRVNLICSNPIINLENFNSIKKWIEISDCLYSFCKEAQKSELKQLSGLSEVN